MALCHLREISFAAANKYSDEKLSDPDVIWLSLAPALSQESPLWETAFKFLCLLPNAIFYKDSCYAHKTTRDKPNK